MWKSGLDSGPLIYKACRPARGSAGRSAGLVVRCECVSWENLFSLPQTLRNRGCSVKVKHGKFKTDERERLFHLFCLWDSLPKDIPKAENSVKFIKVSDSSGVRIFQSNHFYWQIRKELISQCFRVWSVLWFIESRMSWEVGQNRSSYICGEPSLSFKPPNPGWTSRSKILRFWGYSNFLAITREGASFLFWHGFPIWFRQDT